MYKLRIQFLLSFICASLLAHPSFSIDTAAQYAYLMDAETQTVLLDKQGDELMHPSSMSKLMTVYIAFSRLKDGRISMDDNFKVSEAAWRMQGSKSFVPLNAEVPVEALLKGIIVQSGNDACIVLAEGISGSETAFVKEMNKTAKELGMKNTHFMNATGMPDDKHLTTAHDLSILADRLIKDFPEYYDIFAIKEYTFNKIRQFNRNRLLGSLGVDGLKTGHTEAGGYGIALSAKQGPRRLVLVVNGLESDKARINEGDRLLRWGFREFDNYTLVQKGQKVADVDVWYGEYSTVPVTAKESVTVTLPVLSEDKASYMLRYDGPLKSPVKKGDEVGTLIITTPNKITREVPLLAAENVEPLSGFSRVLANMRYYLTGSP